ncbi:MAG: SRPBCC domain-containing protein [Bacteroidota bacterium]
MVRKITQSIKLNKSAKEIFNALIKPSMITKWWSATTAIVVPEKSGCYIVQWGDTDHPDFVTTTIITDIEPEHMIMLNNYTYYAKKGGLPFEADLSLKFIIKPQSHGCELTVINDGFPVDPIADEFFLGCTKGWEDVLNSIQIFLEG